MYVVNEKELAERRALIEELGLDLDPYADLKKRLARLDMEVAKLESAVELM